MIYGFTSKRNACGVTTLALLTGLCIKKKTNKSVCVVDLSRSGHLSRYLDLKSDDKTMDEVLHGYSYSENFVLSDYVISYDDLKIFSGTNMYDSDYYQSRINVVKNVLEEIERYFDIVLVDLHEDLLNDLIDEDTNINPVRILTQNVIDIHEYKDYMTNRTNVDLIEDNKGLRYMFLVNQLDNSIFPEKKYFNDSFSNVIHIPFDKSIKSCFNTGKISLSSVKNTESLEAIMSIAVNLTNGIPESSRKSNKLEKKTFFQKLLRR